MRPEVRLSNLIPPDLVTEQVTEVGDTLIVHAKAVGRSRPCPGCSAPSRRMHNRYIRTVPDLPCSGRRLKLGISARRFVCTAPHYHRRIFVELFGEELFGMRARRTTRLGGAGSSSRSRFRLASRGQLRQEADAARQQ